MNEFPNAISIARTVSRRTASNKPAMRKSKAIGNQFQTLVFGPVTAAFIGRRGGGWMKALNYEARSQKLERAEQELYTCICRVQLSITFLRASWYIRLKSRILCLERSGSFFSEVSATTS